MASLDWTVRAPFQWHHTKLNLFCNLRPRDGMKAEEISHALRESWRLKMWQGFTQANRKDSARFRNLEYDAQRTKFARGAAQGAHEVAVLTGAFVSPARFAKMNDGATSALCHRGCGAIGHFEHTCWTCPLLINPPQPQDELEKWLGWPCSHSNLTTLRHLAKVRHECLQLRWRSPAAAGAAAADYLAA